MPFLFAVTKLDRLARSVGDLLAIVARLEVKKVSLRVLFMSGTQALDTSTSTGRLMLAVIGAVNQAEREQCWSANATVSGRPSAKDATGAVCLPPGDRAPSEIAIRLGIGRASVYRVLASDQNSDRVAA